MSDRAAIERLQAFDAFYEPTHRRIVVEMMNPKPNAKLLDAGCGTGLCGPIVAPLARRLVGVDLSAGMLALAEDKKVYHSLVKAELVDYLSDKREAFDLIVSADALVYFGSLARVISTLTTALRPNGLLAFTLEHVADDNALTDYRLERHGRYSHGQNYIEGLLVASGLQPKIVRAELRMEAGAPVPGLVVRATKPGARGLVRASAG